MSEALAIPSGPPDLTAPWFTAALRDAGVLPEGEVRGVDVTALGEGVLGQLFRIELALDRERAGVPKSVVVKLPARARSSVELCVAFQFYRRELHFYRQRPAWVKLP